MDSIFRLFTMTVFAAEMVISPLPDDRPVYDTPLAPVVSFGQLSQIVPTPEVLGDTIETMSNPPPDVTPTPTPVAHRTKKSSITIALLGDSMTDTLGPGVPALSKLLNAYYPKTSLRILNYGVGSTNIDDGRARLTRDYVYQGIHMNPLVSEKPDVVVVESFGYNPYPVDDDYLNRHWMALAHIVDGIRANLPDTKIIIAATIAPNWNTFGDGATGLSFDPQGKREKVARIKEYLVNAIRFAQSQHLPLADSYNPSLDGAGNGKLTYINGGDHIHYSEAGRELFARKVFEAITANRLLE